MVKKFHIEHLPIAEKDIVDIFEYILTDNPIAASNFINEIDSTISNLEEYPFMGVVPKESRLKYLDYRILIVGNYLVFYVVRESEGLVEIRRVIHGRRKYDFLF